MTRIRRRLAPLGLPMLQVNATGSDKAVRAAETVIDKLIDDRQVAVLDALIRKQVTIAQLVDLDRAGELRGSGILATAAFAKPFFPTFEALFAVTTGRGANTRRRYRVSLHALAASGWLSKHAKVGDLRRVRWQDHLDAWAGSGADWNHLRRMLSRGLTLLLGKQHPTRYEVLALIPRAAERERIPDLNAAALWRIVEHAREDMRAPIVCLALTGMRVRTEYMACTDAHRVAPKAGDRFGFVDVPGTKTAGSRARIAVAASLWPWIEAAIPAPLAYKRFRELWLAALTAAGLPGVRLHDLRHLSAQLAADGGMSDAKIQPHLRHASASMTRRYSRRLDTTAVADAIAQQLGERPDA